MPWTSQRKLRAGFWLLTVIPFVLGFLAYRNAMAWQEDSKEIARTNELVKALEHNLSTLKDVEVAQREFVLSGDERYVAQIERDRAIILNGVDRLGTLGAELRWLGILELLIPQKFDEVRKTIEQRRESGLEAASQELLQDVGAKAMDDIRVAMRNMINDENAQMLRSMAEQRRNFVATMALFAVVLVLNLILLWYVAYRVSREHRQIETMNQDLERRVALRTEALQRSNEDLQQFAYVASHDLKEPMRMISSYAALLERRYKDRLDEDANTYIGFITDGVKRMNALISDLLEYSRAGEIPEEKLVPINANEVLTQVLANLKVTILESKARIHSERLPQIIFDPLRLTQIFQNLIGNAIKYRGTRAPEIEVSAKQEGDETVFAIKDNGIGIEPEHVDEIFGIFKRLHKNEYEGTGIGLAMVKKIVERHGGKIWVQSQPGIGSTFYFTIPHVQPAAAEAATT